MKLEHLSLLTLTYWECLKCEGASRQFQPGEGSIMGLLRDSEIFANLRIAFVSSFRLQALWPHSPAFRPRPGPSPGGRCPAPRWGSYPEPRIVRIIYNWYLDACTQRSSSSAFKDLCFANQSAHWGRFCRQASQYQVDGGLNARCLQC